MDGLDPGTRIIAYHAISIFRIALHTSPCLNSHHHLARGARSTPTAGPWPAAAALLTPHPRILIRQRSPDESVQPARTVKRPLRPATPAPGEAKRAVLSGTFGSALEWFDFAVYGAMAATVFPMLFFND